jgi:hypothetical protein
MIEFALAEAQGLQEGLLGKVVNGKNLMLLAPSFSLLVIPD